MTENQKSLGMNNFNVLVAGALLILLLASVFGALHLYENHLAQQRPARPHAGPSDDERQQLRFESGDLFRETKATQLQDLNSYGWTDSQHQFAKIPLQRAEAIYLNNLKSFGGNSQ